MDNQSIEIIGKIYNAILHGVDWIAVALVILGGLIGKYRLKEWKINNSIKTLIIGTISISVYVLVLVWSGSFVKSDAPKFFFGYITATALYPLIVKPLEKWFKNAFNGE